jgi:GxxExxY protein
MLEENRISREVVDAALKLHKHFGPGIYESVYEPVLVYELKKRNLATRQQASPRTFSRKSPSHVPDLCVFA